MEVSKWKCLKNWLPNPVGRATAQHPLEDEFADMLDNLSVGPLISLPKPVALTEDAWTMQDLRIAISRLQLRNRRFCRVAATCPGRIFDGLASVLQFRVGGWGSSRLLADNLFSHVAEKIRAMHVSDFRPIANLRFKVFAI